MSDPQQQIARHIRRLRRLAALDGVEGTIADVLRDVAQDAAKEPPERAGQTYVRTHTLSGSWAPEPVRRAAGAIIGAVSNPTPYGKWVQGTTTQAWMHRGRWRTVRAIGAAHAQDAAQRVRRVILDLWRRA